ncbi:inositol hexakisphosphate and diphosphoinositol-pentakisphosphate kinase 2 [Elysia marginata]|uniref:Inositol hexakisphosphate and diphosphoinositol-pentakisphosphate kinase 2 n=1 Tax=Elysia marginata TaxID=1093978 RepID=A0AAV4IPQ8_9GAST|nr:inositol hexakisphosphate and diphosphoinositol-pentakisphosphate kinase 2 [Elysia marginata]
MFRENGLIYSKHYKSSQPKIVDFLGDNLHTGLHKPYKKLNDRLTYINRESNSPPSIIKNLPQDIEKRLTNNSSNAKIFEDAAILYKENGHVEALKYAGKKANTTTEIENKEKKQQMRKQKNQR